MNIWTKITNNATHYMRGKAKISSVAMSKATIAAGFELMYALRQGMKKEAPGGEKWPTTSNWVKFNLIQRQQKKYRRRQEKIMARAEEGGTVRKSTVRSLSIGHQTTALKKLISAVRVEKFVNKNDTSGAINSTKVRSGFISSSAGRWALFHLTGPHIIPVTSSMRRMIYACGLVIKALHIRVPKRRTADVVYEKNERVIPDFINQRVRAAMKGQDPKAVKVSWH